ERPQRLRRVEGAGLALEALVRPAPEQRQEQVVHRPEVVVDELGLEAGPGRNAAGRDGGVALLQHEPLGSVEEHAPRLRGLGADSSGCRAHRVPQMYMPPLTPMIWPVM